MAEASQLEADPLVRVAVPLPLPEPLTYSVPPSFIALAKVGSRARVRVGSQRVVGVIAALGGELPPGVAVRPLDEVLDAEPVLGADLLELARFTAEYYRAPIGEVVRSILPADLPPWGDRRIWLTSAGALAPPRDESERAVLDALREGERLSLAELQRRTALPGLAAVLATLEGDGRVASGRSGRTRTSARYVAAVELASADLAGARAAAGRSPAGRAVIDHLEALGRPATVDEVTSAVGCGAAVVRRLVSLGVLRRFDQISRLDLQRHRLVSRDSEPRILRADQAAALATITAALAAGEGGAFLLQGVTGSGKTEVYLQAAQAALHLGRSVILLVPEIALVPALAGAARQRFGERLAILHSALAAGERAQEWERLRSGEARVVLGPRSAIFAPLGELGLVVVDEEQDSAYKQDSTPRYNGRDLALVRARANGAVTLLASATPSLETRANVDRGRIGRLELTARFGQGALPEGVLVDLKAESVVHRPGEVFFSHRLREEITAALAAGDQIILLRNRRGYAPMLLCRACGEDFRCDACGLPRTWHRRDGRLVCHYCGSTQAAPVKCPACGQAALEAIGAGTERVEEIFLEHFPEVAVEVLDRDTVRRPGGVAAVLERFASGGARVLVGTQMVSKGHHFPGVALTAVLSADSYLGFPDFRAVERTYDLLTQLAGRAGRGERPGRVVIQTYHPDHYAIRAALAHDDAGFAAEEMRFRRLFHYPPYTRMAQLLVEDPRRERAERELAKLAAALQSHPLAKNMRITGPAPAPFERLRGRWRFQLLVRSPSGGALHRLLAAVVPLKPGFDLTVDVDPHQLL